MCVYIYIYIYMCIYIYIYIYIYVYIYIYIYRIENILSRLQLVYLYIYWALRSVFFNFFSYMFRNIEQFRL